MKNHVWTQIIEFFKKNTTYVDVHPGPDKGLVWKGCGVKLVKGSLRKAWSYQRVTARRKTRNDWKYIG